MHYRHLFPVLRVLLPFMAGIVMSLSIPAITLMHPGIWFLFFLVTLVSGLSKFKKLKILQKWFFGLVLSGFMLITGYNAVILHKEILSIDHFAGIQTKGIFLASVSEPLQVKDHSVKTILTIVALKKGNIFVEAKGRVLTYFEKDSALDPPPEGSLLVLSGELQEISPPQNPGAFDYRCYMASNNVYHQVYLKNGSYRMLEMPQGFSIYRAAHQVSRKFVNILSKHGLEGKEFAVASALIMGQSDMLDNETLQAYSGTGVMHILSVSGLHVGVIFIIINFLLGFMKMKGGQLFIKTTIILFTIWAYALLTGMSPSVMRSAAMFTFISLGNLSNRYVHIINSLSVSALFLLLIDPLMISNIGFQLSYIAIIGIVFINQPLADLWNPTSRIAQYIWELVAVSIAAQLATAPLAMLYFHQFPNYFIAANLVAIPLSFLAIYAGVAVLATSFVPLVSNFMGIVTNYILLVLNSSVRFIEQLPHSVLHVDSIFVPEMILIYGIIISLVIFMYLRKKQALFIALGMLVLFTVSFSITGVKRDMQKKIIFYSPGRQSAIGFVQGRQQILLADSTLINDKKASKFQLNGASVLYGITGTNPVALDTIDIHNKNLMAVDKSLYCKGANFMFGHKRISVVDSISQPGFGKKPKLKVDFLVIRHNPKLKISNLLQLYDPGLVVIDGTNSVYRNDKWLDECSNAGQKAYSIIDSGALIIDI